MFQIEDVDVFVGSVDGSLRSRHEQERLKAIIDRIDSYDCVVSAPGGRQIPLLTLDILYRLKNLRVMKGVTTVFTALISFSRIKRT